MTKLLAILVLAVVAWRLVVGRWPWQPSARALREQAKGSARALLGIGPDASRQDIIEAHKRLVAMVHPDRGGSNEDVHEANAARDILLGETPNHSREQT